MNGAQIHLLLNHLPVIVPAIGAAVSALGLFLKSRDARDAGAWLIVAGALSAIPTYLTGDPAEHVLKNYPGVSRLLIGDHAAAALPALIMLEIAGAASLAIVLASRMNKAVAEKKWAWALVFALSFLAFTAEVRVAHLGGLIRHEEIRGSDRF